MPLNRLFSAIFCRRSYFFIIISIFVFRKRFSLFISKFCGIAFIIFTSERKISISGLCRICSSDYFYSAWFLSFYNFYSWSYRFCCIFSIFFFYNFFFEFFFWLNFIKAFGFAGFAVFSP